MSEETKSTETVQAENTPEKPPEQAEKTYSEQEYNALKSQLDTVNETLRTYKDYKQKWEKSENDRKDFEHKTKVGSYVKSLGLKDDIYEKLIGGNDVVKQFKEKYPDAFKSADTGGFIAPMGNSAIGKLSSVEQAFYSINPNLKS